jgi:tRNA-dihydrouridine synthase
VIDLNMGCPVPKVCKTGAGAALLNDPDRAVAVARAAREGGGVPVTVKLRSGRRPGDRSGVVLARRLVEEAGVAAIGFHPRSAAVQHKGRPDYDLAAELVTSLPVPVIVSGGLRDQAGIRDAFERTGAAAVMLARGSLGNPWLFEQLLGRRVDEPTGAEIAAELDWVIDRAIEHLGEQRAARFLRKFYPWYAARLGASKAQLDTLTRTETTAAARSLLHALAARETAIAAS